MVADRGKRGRQFRRSVPPLVRVDRRGRVLSVDILTAVDGDVIDVTFTGVLVAGEAYTLDFYADHNGDTLCTGFPDDHVWHQPFGKVTGDTTQPIDHEGSTIDSAGCDSF